MLWGGSPNISLAHYNSYVKYHLYNESFRVPRLVRSLIRSSWTRSSSLYSKVCIIALNPGSIGGKLRATEFSVVRMMTGPVVIPRARPTRKAEED